MILGFKRKFPWGEPSGFKEKILVGAMDYESSFEMGMLMSAYAVSPKLHTIREDKHNRWHAGIGIQMVYRGVKYKIEDHFNKDIKELSLCRSTQSISIENWNDKIVDKSFGFVDCLMIRGIDFHNYWMVFVDDRPLTDKQIKTLAINDGFENCHQFFRWFKPDFRGKIIHWTNLKY